MKFFFDTEFMEDGKTIDLLSIGIVAEDGREFYAVNAQADLTKANDFVREKVIPHLHAPARDWSGVQVVDGPAKIREALLEFVGDPQKSRPEFWGYYADYDWVVFCQLFGRMIDLPRGFPMYCRDIMQYCDFLGNHPLPQMVEGEHHALMDARWNKQQWELLDLRDDADRFWRKMVFVGMPTAAEIRAELQDFAILMENVPQVYMAVTGGRFSKPMTRPDVIISAMEEHVEKEAAIMAKEKQADTLEWTDKPPMQEGHFFYRLKEAITLVRVQDLDGWFASAPGMVGMFTQEIKGGQWAGPVALPAVKL